MSLLRLRRLGAEALDERLQMLTLRLLLLQQLQLQRLPLGALPFELAVAAAIDGELALIEMDDRIDRLVEKVAVMR